MTYGEACIREQHSVVMERGKWIQKIKIVHKPKRMSRDDAAKYYTDKINKEFDRLGYKRKKKPDFPHVNLKGFNSVDDYYGFHEAKKLYTRVVA